MRLFLSAGEVSGDVAGALLARALRRRRDLDLFGIGGFRMEAEGVRITHPTNHLGTVGVSESFRAMPGLSRVFLGLRREIRASPPAAAVLIANDVFHVLLGRWLRRHGVKTASWFPPQVWIWRSLARPFSRSFDAILTAFPDEQAVYQRASGRAAFVGHYLADQLAPPSPLERAQVRARLGLPPEGTVVGLLPGSRVHEVRLLGPLLAETARLLTDRDPSLRFVLPVAEPLFFEPLAAEIAARGLGGKVTLAGPGPDALRAADLAVLASGTASLEASLLGVPMVVLYRVSALTIGVVRSAIRLGLMDSETVALPNLVLGRPVVPELIQKRLTAPAAADAAWVLLSEPGRREETRAALAEVAAGVRGFGAVDRAAEAVLALADAPLPARAHAVAPGAEALPARGGR